MFNIQELKPYFTNFKEKEIRASVDCPRCGKKDKAYFYKNTFKILCNSPDCSYASSMFDFLIEFHGFKDTAAIYAYFKKEARYPIHPDNKKIAKYFLGANELDLLTRSLQKNDVEKHPYVIKKRITPYKGLLSLKKYHNSAGHKITEENTLMIPFQDVSGELKSYLRIYEEEGEKKILAGTSPNELFCCLKTMDTNSFILVEGWATGCSLQAVTETTVLCCGPCHNVEKVIKALFNHYGNNLSLTLGGDRIGWEKLQQTAQKYELDWSIPTLGDDWNDVHVAHGLEQVKKEYEANLRSTINSIALNDTPENQQNLKPTEFIVPFLPKKGSALIYGNRGTMKTWFALSFAITVASGGVVFNKWQVNGKDLRVLYVSGEMDYDAIIERVNKIKEKMGLDYPLGDNLVFMARKDLPNCHLQNERFIKNIYGAITKYKIDIVILDNLATLTQGVKEDKQDEWSSKIVPIITKIGMLGAATKLIHNTNKSGGQRGTIAKEDTFDNVVKFQSMGRDKTMFVSEKNRCGKGEEIEPFIFAKGTDDTIGNWNLLSFEEEMENQILTLLEDVSGKFTLNDIKEELEMPKKAPLLKVLKILENKGKINPWQNRKPIFLADQAF